MRALTLAFVALSLAATSRAQDPLAAAQALYVAAQYEEALKAFDAVRTAAGTAPAVALAAEQGKAFCLLALDRKADAERAIEAILGLDPFFRPSEDDTPPKIRSAFREVRRRALPTALQQIYQRAKDAYERKAFDDALTGFGQVLKLLDDPDLVLEAGPRGDMRMVARAFEDLAKAARPAPAPAAPGTAGGGTGEPGRPDTVTAPGGRAAPDASGRPPGEGALPAEAVSLPLYDAASKDVTPPVAQRTDVPISPAIKRTLPGGDVVVEVVVSEKGTVESAVARRAPDPLLGAIVAGGVRDWRFRPATRAGKPVRYRMMVRVVVS